jgi:hypothetical protein
MQTATISFEVDVFVEAMEGDEPEITEIGLVIYDPTAAIGRRHRTSRMVPVSAELSRLILDHLRAEALDALADADTDHAEQAAEHRWEMASGR